MKKQKNTDAGSTKAKLSQDRYKVLFDRSPDAIVISDPDGNILDFNTAALTFFGLSRSEMTESNILQFYANREDRSVLIGNVNEQQVIHNTPVIFVDNDKKVKHSLVTAMQLTDENGVVYGYQSMIRDITQYRLARKKLHHQKNFAEKLIHIAPEAIAIIDLDGKIIRVNQEFCNLFQYPEKMCNDQSIDDLIVPDHLKAESLSLFARSMGGECLEVESVRGKKDGTLVDVSILAKPISTELDEPAIYVIYRDISNRLRKDRELRYIAYHDMLTGLPNRKSFYSSLDDLLRHSGRRNSDRVWALMFLDLDTFKQVNDTLGHDTGDQLLKGVAERLKNCLRETDHLFRLSGDEFTIILTDLNRDIDVARVAKKILEIVRKPFRFNSQEIFTSTSIGISVYPNDGWDVEGLVKNADIAMYAAKEKGGDNYRFFTEEMNRKALHRMKLEGSLRQAMDRNELRLYYQPLVNRTNQIEGMEALLRWQHPELGLILPSEFIRITEETGIIVPVGKWVMETACRQTKRWHEMGFSNLFVSVNVAARQLQEPDFEKVVMDIVDKTGIPPTSLKLEVTEGSMIQNPERCIAKMKYLRSKGISFSIDDFGTGYSSLSYLKRFPIDALKIDRSFIIDSMSNKGDREIIKTILSMAKNLNIDTIAEGVETNEQKEFLTNSGCKTMQGFLFAQPIPVGAFKKLLEQQRKTPPPLRAIPAINQEK